MSNETDNYTSTMMIRRTLNPNMQLSSSAQHRWISIAKKQISFINNIKYTKTCKNSGKKLQNILSNCLNHRSGEIKRALNYQVSHNLVSSS